jgi:spore germination cell wall hydrolase CwlJ-like protein
MHGAGEFRYNASVRTVIVAAVILNHTRRPLQPMQVARSITTPLEQGGALLADGERELSDTDEHEVLPSD